MRLKQMQPSFSVYVYSANAPLHHEMPNKWVYLQLIITDAALRCFQMYPPSRRFQMHPPSRYILINININSELIKNITPLSNTSISPFLIDILSPRIYPHPFPTSFILYQFTMDVNLRQTIHPGSPDDAKLIALLQHCGKLWEAKQQPNPVTLGRPECIRIFL